MRQESFKFLTDAEIRTVRFKVADKRHPLVNDYYNIAVKYNPNKEEKR